LLHVKSGSFISTGIDAKGGNIGPTGEKRFRSEVGLAGELQTMTSLHGDGREPIEKACPIRWPPPPVSS
jgi:hypothetical protein